MSNNTLIRVFVACLAAASLALGQQALTNGLTSQQTAAWTSASTAGASGVTLVQPMATVEPFVTTGGYTTAVVSYSASGTITGGAITFEVTAAADGNSGWQTATCYRMGTTPSADSTYTLITGSQIWQCPAAGVLNFRARLSTPITGSGTANLTIQATTAVAGASNAYIPIDQPALTTPLNTSSAAGVTNANRITRTYLGFNSTNTAKTTTLTFSQAVKAGDALVVVAFSGNFNSANWTGTVTDSALNTCTLIASGTNSTTQFAGVYVCPNETAVTTATFTIAGSNSANATTGLVAYDVGNVGTTVQDIVDTANGSGASSGTAIALAIGISNTVPNSLVIGGTCAAGTISAGGTFYVADSGIQAPASAANCVDMAAQSVLLSESATATMPFTQGSAAWANVAIVIKPLTVQTDALPKLTGNRNATNPAVVAEKGTRRAVTSNPGSAATASVTFSSTATNGIAVIDCLSYTLANNGTAIASAATVNLTITGGTQGTKFNKALSYQTTAGLVYADGNICGLGLASNPGEVWTIAFSANATNLLESITVTGFDIAQPLTY